MKRLVLFCDGTWNDKNNTDRGEDARTNVCRLWELTPESSDQKTKYIEGVGSFGKVLGPILGGAFGVGLKRDVRQGYEWLARHWDRGDEIYIFGFSRGAYTARSIAGLVAGKGLLDLRTEGDPKRRKNAALAVMWQARPHAFRGGERRLPRGIALPREATVQFLGIWDTVGSLGIPSDMGHVRDFFGQQSRHQFTDTFLNKNVLTARHAVAIDEKRFDFTPTLWRSDPKTSSANRSKGDWEMVEQKWFSGAHGDVGGGRFERGLSNITLKWVAQGARELGLEIDDAVFDEHPENPMTPHLPFEEHGIFVYRPSRVRAVPHMTASPYIGSQALEKHMQSAASGAPYWPTQDLAVGASHRMQVVARTRWNASGLHVTAGQRYSITASGRWKDLNYETDADGLPNDFTRKKPAFRFVSIFERRVRRLRKNGHPDADGRWIRRDMDQNWFALMGAVASGQGIAPATATVADHEMFHVGKARSGWSPNTSGYLYFFANDAASKYDNNSGALELTIMREA